ncbi:MAG: radical SAM protein, partial [Campylobacterales bacterium]|nr:radical SAM protein [Campylobacterales bacterium]
NIDIKSFNEKYYKKHLGGKLANILENLKFFVQNNIHVEITTLIVPTQNDSEDEIRQIASFIANELGVNIPWHISAFHPDYKELDLPPTSIEILKKARDIGEKCGLEKVYLGNVRIDDE